MSAHTALAYVLAIFLVAAPFLFGFSTDGKATAFFLGLGVAHLLVTIATSLSRIEPDTVT